MAELPSQKALGASVVQLNPSPPPAPVMKVG